MNGILPRKQWPSCLHQGPEGALVGVFIGGCVARGVGSSFRRVAHAHTDGAHSGWICIRSARRLSCTNLLIHELAHIISGEGHTDAFRRVMLQLGGTLDAVVGEPGRDDHKRTRQLKDKTRPHLGYQHHPACPCYERGGPRFATVSQ